MSRRWLRTPASAEHLNVTPAAMIAWRGKGIGPRYSKLGAIVVYDVADLDAWAAERAVEPRVKSSSDGPARATGRSRSIPLGGRRPGAGRPPGSPNKRTAAVARAVAEAAARLDAAIPGAFAGDAHAFLCSIYRDPAQPIQVRIDAAKAAIRYEKPALASVDVKADVDVAVRTVSDRPLTPEQWLAEVESSGSA